MYATKGNTQVYSPFGSLVVEQHDGDDGRSFESLDVPSPRRAGDILSNEQAAVGLTLQRHYSADTVGPAPTRLQALLNLLLHRSDSN